MPSPMMLMTPIGAKSIFLATLMTPICAPIALPATVNHPDLGAGHPFATLTVTSRGVVFLSQIGDSRHVPTRRVGPAITLRRHRCGPRLIAETFARRPDHETD
jgi:hypothetical protein